MELEDVRERAVWENNRLVLAFGLRGFRKYRSFSNAFCHCSCLDGHHIQWFILKESGELVSIRLENQAEICAVSQLAGGVATGCWKYFPPHPLLDENYFRERMARGIYRLGFEHEAMFDQMEHLLSAHEKLELRLSLPREFWPQKWLDEEVV